MVPTKSSRLGGPPEESQQLRSLKVLGSAARTAIAPHAPTPAAIAHIMRIVASTLLSIRQTPQSAVAPEGPDAAIEVLQGAKRLGLLDLLT